MKEEHERTALLFGEAIEHLYQCRVAVFGLGGVGGAVAEALARSGVGQLDLIDADVVSLSNINRQIIALHSTVGKYKTDVMAERIQDIDPDVQVRCHRLFYLPETAADFDFSVYDYVVDAVDTVSAKLSIIQEAKAVGVPVISSMGTGNKKNPSAFEIADISKTSVCPLARVMRIELRKRGISGVKVVYSKEMPVKSSKKIEMPKDSGRRSVPGSCAFVPPAAGLLLAGEVIRDLLGQV
ncbi:MAG: tRNA threonylcarbamoyladenosine dehydratase [Clostridiales bacterium]|nr:tRNA threonylcarbamoyladenosine dehydratase [Clostridiales bacterium]